METEEQLQQQSKSKDYISLIYKQLTNRFKQESYGGQRACVLEFGSTIAESRSLCYFLRKTF